MGARTGPRRLLIRAAVPGRWVAAAAVVLALAGQSVAVEPSSPALEELRQGFVRGLTGAVEGRIYIERAKPNAPDDPLVGVGILLLPRSDELLERLETAKRQSRDSMRGFREAVPTVRAVVEDQEAQLWQAGYPDAAVRSSTDASGAFRVDVPAGAWILVAERSVFVPLHTARSGVSTATSLDPLARYSTTAYQHFLPTRRLTGYDATTVWLRELTVETGQRVAIELHDRGVWLSGVVEETETPRRVRYAPSGPKR